MNSCDKFGIKFPGTPVWLNINDTTVSTLKKTEQLKSNVACVQPPIPLNGMGSCTQANVMRTVRD